MNNHNCGMHFIYFPKSRLENEFDGDYIYLRRLRAQENEKNMKSKVKKSKRKKTKAKKSSTAKMKKSISKEKKVASISEKEKLYYEQLARLLLEDKKKKVTA